MADMKKVLKAALYLRYAAGKGGHRKPVKKRSRRDDIRDWNREHPDNQLNLRRKTGRPAWWAEMKERADDDS